MKFLKSFCFILILTSFITSDVNSQNVGIGNNTPLRKLHVSNGTDSKIRISSSDIFTPFTYSSGLELTTSNPLFGINSDWLIENDGNALKFIQGTNSFATIGSEKMRIMDNGFVGIGTVIPNSKLNIFNGAEVNYTDNGHFMIGASTFLNMIFDENEILARNAGVASPLYLQNDGGDVLLCAKELGGVGIGVGEGNIPPGYLLAVDGKIISEEIRVELSGNWPDYVFEDSYALMPLSQVAESIEKNKHLPGIPSAKEVAESGQMLGDIQKRLLEKIEELMLYTIQQQKEIDALKAAILKE